MEKAMVNIQDRIEEKMRELISKHQENLKERRRLEEENQRLREQLKEKDSLLEELQLKGDASCISGKMGETQKREMDKKLNQYLKEIDKCINLLND